MIYRVREVLNYGGFFAGDTVTLTAHAVTQPDDEISLTIDQGALTNLDDRFQIVAGMALDVQSEGDHVVSAALLAAPERATLRTAVKPAREPALAAHSANGGANSPAAADHNAATGADEPDPTAQSATLAASAGAPRIFSHYCAQCKLWILGAPRDGKCGVEGHAL